MLSEQQKIEFNERGFLVLDGLLDVAEIALLHEETDRVFQQHRPEVIRTDTGEPRVAMAMHRYSDVFTQLLRHPKILEPVRDLCNEPFYCHQYKIVTKHPFSKLALAWHQDFGTWSETDGMPEPKALTIGIFLEEVNEFNGALVFVPGSHKTAVLDSQSEVFEGKTIKSITLGVDALKPLMKSNGLVSPKGPAGTVIIFHASIAHSSGPNLTADWRHVVYISPNPVSNHIRDPKRDDMFALLDFTPMQAEPGLSLTRTAA